MTDGVAPVARLWNDYICPWAYAARPLTAWLRAQGVDVGLRCYELHPELPPEGRSVRPGGRLDRVLDHIATVCASQGQPFVKPTRSPNSRLSLEVVEVAAVHTPEHLDAIDDALADAHWHRQLPIDDRDVVADVVAGAAGPAVAATIMDLQANGDGARRLEASRAEALELGVTATPAWRIGELTIVGLHPRSQFERWATRLLERSFPVQ